MTDHKDPREAYTVYDPETDNTFHFDTESDARDKIETAERDFGIDAELYPPGTMPGEDDPAEEPQDAEPVDDADFEPASSVESQAPVEVFDESGAASGPLQPVDPDATVAMYDEYEQLKSDLLSRSDYQESSGDKFIKKSGWRKIATAFNVDVDVVDTDREQSDGVIRYRVEAVATAPNGKTVRALGMAESSESNFMDTVNTNVDDRSTDGDPTEDADVFKVDGKYRRLREPRAVKEHDVLTLASTRAKNRAISDLVGGGEVSAEEVR